MPTLVSVCLTCCGNQGWLYALPKDYGALCSCHCVKGALSSLGTMKLHHDSPYLWLVGKRHLTKEMETPSTTKPTPKVTEFKAEDLGKRENLQAQIRYVLEERRKREAQGLIR